jgi:hypothetical protein
VQSTPVQHAASRASCAAKYELAKFELAKFELAKFELA